MRRGTIRGLTVWCDGLERESIRGGIPERVVVRFTGRGPVPRPSPGGLLEALEPQAEGDERNAPEPAWARQIHSSRVLEARAGDCGEGDALVTVRAGLALSVVTADCVPLLLASSEPGGPLAAVHAGWRGIAAEIVPRTLERLEDALGTPGSSLVAWIGPAIGPCCYEVGAEVAERVARVSAEDVVRRPPKTGPGAGQGKPHLDLAGAVRSQLVAAGVADVRCADRCTRCNPTELWSYRREGEGAGRNYAFVWVRRAGAPCGSRSKARS